MAGGHAFDALRLFCLFLFLSSTLHKETSPNDSALVFYPRFSILHRRSAALKLPVVKESKRGLLSLALPFNNHVTLPAYFAFAVMSLRILVLKLNHLLYNAIQDMNYSTSANLYGVLNQDLQSIHQLFKIYS